MTLHADLLHLARRLATVDRTRPKQANLRRAVSTAYYALFHHLVDDGVASVANRSRAAAARRQLVSRKFERATMYRASRGITSGAPWSQAAQASFPPEILVVADAFVLLQEERHHADYGLEPPLTRARAIRAVELAEGAFEAWQRIRGVRANKILPPCHAPRPAPARVRPRSIRPLPAVRSRLHNLVD